MVVKKITAGLGTYNWTTLEIKVVRELYPTGGPEACKPHLPFRTISAIYNRARVLGIKYEKVPGSSPRKKWFSTDEIDREIVSTYQNNPEKNAINKLAERVSRPRWWVTKRAAKLGCYLPRFKEPDWIKAEEELLEKHAHKTPDIISGIFARNGFARSATAIIVKRKRLNCDLRDYDHYTASHLAKEFGVDIKAVTRWINNGWLKASRRGTKRTRSQGGDMWWVRRRDVKAFVADNVAQIDFRKVDKVWLVDLLVNT
jgi:hypothetical protein